MFAQQISVAPAQVDLAHGVHVLLATHVILVTSEAVFMQY